MDAFVVKKAPRKGMGLFALKRFRRGQLVYHFPQGPMLRLEQLPKLPKSEQRFIDQVRPGVYELMQAPGRYVNHSCNPNISERGRAGYARRTILPGEELTIDYRKLAFFEKPFRCHCGTSVCVGIIYPKT